MTDQNALFRKAALDKLASPERLDVLMQVTSPQGWAALLTIGAILIGGLVWSIVGSLPERVDGQGVLISGGGLRQITANGAGMLTALKLSVHDRVATGELVGEIRTIGADEKLQASAEKYEEARRNAESANLTDRNTIQSFDLQILDDRTLLADLTNQLNEARTRLAERQASFDAGNITANVLQQQKDKVSSLTQQISGRNQSILGKQAQKGNIEQQIRTRNLQVEGMKSQTTLEKSAASEVAQVKALVDGRVIDVRKKAGERVNVGDVVAVVEPDGSGFEAVVFVSSEVGKRIKTDMDVQISPSGIKREEYGFMRGTVTRVSDYAVTAESVVAAISNPEQAKKFLTGGTKFELRVAPTLDPSTPSGFAWSSSSGPPLKITSGTEVTLSVIVDRHAPIAEVLPFLKKMIGSS